MEQFDSEKELKHFGILGMKWGIRRYQNPDGTLTAEGRERYGVKTAAETKRLSYSRQYETLKYKGKKRSEDEEKKFQALQRGHDWFIDKYIPAKMKNKIADGDSADVSAGLEYMLSTNYGKKVSNLSRWGIGYTFDESEGIYGKRDKFYQELLTNTYKNGKERFSADKKRGEDLGKYLDDNATETMKRLKKELKPEFTVKGIPYYKDPDNKSEVLDIYELTDTVNARAYDKKYTDKNKFYK